MNFNWTLLLPECVAFIVLMFLLVGEISSNTFSKSFAGVASLVGAALVFVSVIPLAGITGSAFNGSFLVDNYSTFFKGFFAITFFGVLQMTREFSGQLSRPGEFYLILWSAFLGFFFLVSANDLLLLFISLEIIALSFYIMAAYLKKRLSSIEAGLKYLIIGSLASAMMIYGISLVFAAVGSTKLPDVRLFFAQHSANKMLILGFLLMISGIGFKIAAVPFHLWVPDVYEGAPTPTVAFLSIASKAAGFAILMRLLFMVFTAFDAERILLFGTLALMTLLYGNLGALGQTNIKRLFGYSSIGHAGYLLIGVAAGGHQGVTATLYYLMAYGVANLAAFLAITLAGVHLESDHLDSYRGLAKRAPVLTGVLFIALLSLAGVPPLAGFFGKFLVLLAAVRSDMGWLALIGALAVVIALYYYLMIIKRMFIDESTNEEKIKLSPLSQGLLVSLGLAIVVMGVWQAPFFHIAEQASLSLF